MNGQSESSGSGSNAAELTARRAKEAFDQAQLLEDASIQRVTALQAIKAALQAAKQDILAANKLDMDVRTQLRRSSCFAPPYRRN
jgi:gamma-glutamyl phosphate reductase